MLPVQDQDIHPVGVKMLLYHSFKVTSDSVWLFTWSQEVNTQAASAKLALESATYAQLINYFWS